MAKAFCKIMTRSLITSATTPLSLEEQIGPCVLIYTSMIISYNSASYVQAPQLKGVQLLALTTAESVSSTVI